jgi:hypothetical protein
VFLLFIETLFLFCVEGAHLKQQENNANIMTAKREARGGVQGLMTCCLIVLFSLFAGSYLKGQASSSFDKQQNYQRRFPDGGWSLESLLFVQ